MSAVWEQRFSDFVARVCGLRESTSLELLPDLMPVLPVINPEHADLHLARGEKPITCTFDITAAAGQFPTWWIGNPAGNHLLILEHLIVAVSSPQEIRFGSGPEPLPGAPVQVAVDDERVRNTATPILRVTESAVAQIQGRSILISSSQSFVFPLQQVIPPGFNFRVQGTGALTRMVGMVQGFERPAGARETRTS